MCGAHRETIEHLLDSCPVLFNTRLKLAQDLQAQQPNINPTEINWKVKLGATSPIKLSNKTKRIITHSLVKMIHIMLLHNIHL